MEERGETKSLLRSFVQQEHVSQRKIIWLISVTEFS